MKPPVRRKPGNKTILKALDWFQNRAFVHPLTCGLDSTHRILVGGETEEGKLYMECPDCDYMQFWVPDFVWEIYLSQMSMAVTNVQAARS